MVDISEWSGLASGRPDRPMCLEVQLVFPGRGDGGSAAVPVHATDGRRWWLKPLNNPQGPRVPSTEYLVGRIGSLIGAPTCEVSIVRIDKMHEQASEGPGSPLQEGYAYGSLDVAGAREHKSSLEYRAKDDNRRRHVGIFALWDLCFGADPQWLHQAIDDERTWSHDHGHYFPSGPNWTEQTLIDNVLAPHELASEKSDLDPLKIEEVAALVEGLNATTISTILKSVPAPWPISDSELETLGWFILERSGPVGQRLRSLARVEGQT